MSLCIKLPEIGAAAPEPRYLDILEGGETAVQRVLRRGGLAGWEPVHQATLLALCETASSRVVFYDIGAHVAMYCALVSSLFPTSVCVAFEPSPITLKVARQIRDRNGLPYHIVGRAVSDAVSKLTFYLSPKAESSNSLNPDFRKGSEPTIVKATTIDRYLRDGGPAPTLMKIDVETHEPAVFAGARKTIEKHHPHILCELLRMVDPAKLLTELEWLSAAGYRFFNMTDDLVWKEYGAAEVVAKLAYFEDRDWLFTLNPPGETLMARIGAIVDAIGRLDKSTNRRGDAVPAVTAAASAIQSA